MNGMHRRETERKKSCSQATSHVHPRVRRRSRLDVRNSAALVSSAFPGWAVSPPGDPARRMQGRSRAIGGLRLGTGDINFAHIGPGDAGAAHMRPEDTGVGPDDTEAALGNTEAAPDTRHTAGRGCTGQLRAH